MLFAHSPVLNSGPSVFINSYLKNLFLLVWLLYRYHIFTLRPSEEEIEFREFKTSEVPSPSSDCQNHPKTLRDFIRVNENWWKLTELLRISKTILNFTRFPGFVKHHDISKDIKKLLSSCKSSRELSKLQKLPRISREFRISWNFEIEVQEKSRKF